ncbi:MAG: uroporphyrinogen-III synthase [Bryobacteraceae bacterium]|nr:uroporphyrinogen-III synthase [Bryobacteraceae bacterium]
MSFSGLRVLSLESRRAREMETLIRKQGGDPFIAPSVRERALEEHRDAFSFARRLVAGEFDLVVCMTGTGLKFLAEVVADEYTETRLAAAFAAVTTVSRGPKPAAVLRAWGVPVGVTIPEPNTWREIVDVLSGRNERRLAVQEYGRPNPELTSALEGQGRQVSSFAIYRWDLPEDEGPLREAAKRIAGGACDVVLFTSSVQLEHLLRVAAGMALAEDVLRSLRGPMLTASIGPLMTEAMAEHGIVPDIVPEHPKMGALVKAAADQAALLLTGPIRRTGP